MGLHIFSRDKPLQRAVRWHSPLSGGVRGCLRWLPADDFKIYKKNIYKMTESVRIDKWLWAVRAFKTRSMASDACRSGKVTIDGQEVKPSREVKIDDGIKVVISPHFTRSLKVVQFLSNRVGAKLVATYADDVTTAEEYERFKKYNELNWERRDRGVGRPTKKERRDIERLKGEE